MKEGEKLNKNLKLITPDVIEECLCESLDIIEKNTQILKKNLPSHRKIKISLK